MAPTLTAVVVAYGAEPWLERAVAAVLASTGIATDVVLVDNGCTDGAIDRLDGHDRVTVVRPGANLGFAEGCNVGVAHATGELVALVNPDLLVEGDCLAQLGAVAAEGELVIATASVRLAEEPELLNSAGNDIHWTGMSWSGAFRERAADHAARRDAFAASGACMVVSRRGWERLGGFEPAFFAYYEDADLSMRAWQAGGRVVFVPEAVCVHRYEFGRRPEKMFLLERNRLLLVLSCWETRTLAVCALPLLAMELGIAAMAAKDGWWPEKRRSWRWLVDNRRLVMARRRAVRAQRVVRDRELVGLFAPELRMQNVDVPAWWPQLNRVLRAYWAIASRLV